MKNVFKPIFSFSHSENQNTYKDITFFTYQEEISLLQLHMRKTKSNCIKKQDQLSNSNQHQFNPDEREHLKNAFRYICRLIFKESLKYIGQFSSYLNQSESIQKPLKSINLRQKLSRLVSDAQMISGERYFKEYLQNLQDEDKLFVVVYMIWFLQKKYLRYIKKGENEKGKRKSMKKELYLRFKNDVMLPYLINCQDNLIKLEE